MNDTSKVIIGFIVIGIILLIIGFNTIRKKEYCMGFSIMSLGVLSIIGILLVAQVP